MRFLRPAVFDDRLLVHARCHAVRGARFRFDYVVDRDGTPIADGWTTHAAVDAATLRPTRLPDWLTDRDRYSGCFPVGAVTAAARVRLSASSASSGRSGSTFGSER